MILRPRLIRLAQRNVYRPRHYSNLADLYHSKVSVIPFTKDAASIQAKIDLLTPSMFGLRAAILGYAQMLFGSDVVDAGIKRTQFKPVYIPTWVVHSIVSFTSRTGDDGDGQDTTMHLRETVIPGIDSDPLCRWIMPVEDDLDNVKPFSKHHLEELEGGHEIVPLPFTTSPLAIPKALSELPLQNVEISEGWTVDPRSVKIKMLTAYPVLQPVYLTELSMGDQNITILAHGHHEAIFSVWGHPNQPNRWVGSGSNVTVTYLRTLQQMNRGPDAIAEFISELTVPENLAKLAGQVDMDDPRIQSASSANATEEWMKLAAKVDELKFIIESIPANTKAHVINIGPGMKASSSPIEADARAPLQSQLKELEEELEASKPEWMAKWDELNGGSTVSKDSSGV